MGLFSKGQRKTSRSGSLILLFMLLAFALKAVLPAGFMPGRKDGLMALVICSGLSEKTIFVPAGENSPTQDHSGDQSDKPVCAYQALASGKTLIPAPILALAAPAVIISHDFPAEQQRPHASFSRSFEARGPPRA